MKQNLNEQVSRIKDMMKKVTNESFMDWFSSPKKIEKDDKWQEERFTCQDCGESDYRMYMVNDDIWSQFGNEKLTLCRSCLQKRMGREMTKNDISQYKDALVNIHNPELVDLN